MPCEDSLKDPTFHKHIERSARMTANSQHSYTPAEQLVEIEKIKRVKYRYYRLLDLKRFDEIPNCFTPDIQLVAAAGKHVIVGIDNLVGMLRSHLSDQRILTFHRIGQGEVDITSRDTATATWGQDDISISLVDDIIIRGAMYYEDQFRKVDGQWLISHSKYSRIYEEHEPREGRSATIVDSLWGKHSSTE
jgi:hypothetical protein